MHKSPRQLRRWLVRVPLLIALGATTTVAIAWAGAAFEHTLEQPEILEDIVHGEFAASVYVKRGRLVHHVGVDWESWIPRTPRRSSAGTIALLDTPAEKRKSRTPNWSKAWLTQRPERPPSTWGGSTRPSPLNELGAGWPWRALRCEFDSPVHLPGRTPAAVYTPRAGIALECHAVGYPRSTTFQPRALPYGVIVRGFAADTGVFGLGWFAALYGVRGARRRLRAARGACPRCGYDLRATPADLPCPECGRGRLRA